MIGRLGLFLWVLVGCAVSAGVLCLFLDAIDIVDEIALLAAMLTALAYGCTGLPWGKS